MDRQHTFEFVESTVACSVAEELKAYYPSTDTYYQYYDPRSASSMSLAISQLAAYVLEEGPSDGVLGYSQGAVLAATYLIQFSQQHPSSPLPFKCAIFFSGGRPLDPQELAQGKLKWLDPKETGPLLKLPTTNIWGRNDTLWPGTSEVLSELCEEPQKNVYIHEEGHDIPGARAKEAVQGCVRAIRRTIERGLIAQERLIPREIKHVVNHC
ncbi:hypothetical protein MMC30_008214 [Trapelia coarctata]|nr:hypothetical protein [Trapelia coarctata]